MKQTKTFAWKPLAGIAAVAFTLSAWASPEVGMPSYFDEFEKVQDTSRPSRKIRIEQDYKQEDLDKAMKELDRAMIDLDKKLKIDFSKMDREIKLAMEQIKTVDAEKIAREVQASLKNIDWEKTSAEINRALKEVQVKFKEVDMKEINRELKKVNEELKAQNFSINMDKIRDHVTEGLAQAKIGIKKAKEELAELKTLTDELEKDGLIDKKKGYRIEIKNKKLIINGKEQSQQVNEKYKKYLNKDDFSISSDGNGAYSMI